MNLHSLGQTALIAMQVGLLVWIVWRMKHQSRVFPCPVCQKSVDRDALRVDGVLCPHCGWYVRPPRLAIPASNPTAILAPEDQSCPVCDETLTDENCLLAWDGKTYCRACVASVSPKLLKSMSQKNRLEESFEVSSWAIRRKAWLILWGGVTAIFCIPMSFAIFAEGLVAVLTAILVMQLLIIPITTAFALTMAHAFLNRLPSATLKDGLLTVRAGSQWSATHPLHKYEWFRGDLSMMSSQSFSLASGPALLLVMPKEHTSSKSRKKGNEFKPEYVAIGYTKRTRMLWQKLFSLSGVTHREDLELKKSWKLKLAEKTGPILVVPLSFCFGFLLGAICFLTTELLTNDRNLAGLVGGMVLIYGAIYSLFYATVIWPKTWKPVPDRDGYDDGTDKPRRYRLSSLAIPALISISMISWNGITFKQKLIAIPIQFIVSFLLGCDLDRRVRLRKEQSTTD